VSKGKAETCYHL